MHKKLCIALLTVIGLLGSLPASEPPTPLLFGGCGGVYLLAEPGDLVIDVFKRDRNRRSAHTELRAILVGPDREVLGQATIPDDGQGRGSGRGPIQQARLSTRVDRKGVFAVNITVSRDRYGQEMVWGFRTNCAKYLIETSRGHKDERHQEPIVLASPSMPADVCFRPRRGTLAIEVSGLPPGSKALELFDGSGKPLASLEADSRGGARKTFSPEVSRMAGPWRLRLPSAQATIHIDGVTRWERGDPHADLCIWTPDPSSWFPFLEYRWLLTPYKRTVHGEAGREGEIEFQLHSSAERTREVRLAVEFPDCKWPVRIAEEKILLTPGKTIPVSLHYTVPSDGERRRCHLRATPVDERGFSTYSTLRVVAGKPPALDPIAMPIQLEPYRHENEQFGYLPKYPVKNQVYFDQQNRPHVSLGGAVAMRRGTEWVTRSLRGAVIKGVSGLEGNSFSALTTKIAFDRDGDLYLIARCGRSPALLHSADGGETFSAHAIPGRGGYFDIEQFSGHNVSDHPPPFVRFTRTASDPKLIWRRINDLELFLPQKVNGTVMIGAPILLSKKCIGLSAHSGIPSSVVSRGSRVHVAWGEATDPKKPVPGVPTYVATYDRERETLGKPILVGHGPPANDIHNSPSITMDSRGHLHVLVGTHGRPFQYVRSLEPNSASGGFTDAVLSGEGLSQTYIGFVCGQDDTLHVVFRLWRSGPPYPHSTHATLAYQRKRPGKPWEEPKILIVAPFSEYSIFYHRLTIDRRGRLFLSYDYWSTYWFYRNDLMGSRRALLMSPDGGETWKLASEL